jgi:Na+-driven multidrug efflux pump
LAATPITDKKISRAVLYLALPAIAHSFLQTLIFLVDRALLGHYSTTALASLRLTGPLIWCITGVLSCFTIGSVALVGRAVGAEAQPLATAAAKASLLLALGIGTVTSLISLLGLDGIFSLFPGVTPAVTLAAKGYLVAMAQDNCLRKNC